MLGLALIVIVQNVRTKVYQSSESLRSRSELHRHRQSTVIEEYSDRTDRSRHTKLGYDQNVSGRENVEACGM